jgi:hypothetical protein
MNFILKVITIMLFNEICRRAFGNTFFVGYLTAFGVLIGLALVRD